MSNLLKGSAALLIFAFAISVFQISCKKDSVAQTNTNELTKPEILVAKTWKVDKLHHVIAGSYSEYQDGVTNTTGIPYENLRFKFEQNGTGTHIDQFNNSYNFTWSLSTDQRTISITVMSPNPVSYDWDMVEIADNYLHASVNLVVGGSSDNLETFRLIQIP